jgi:hypothetical protein
MGTTETLGYKRIGGIGMTNKDTLLMEASIDGTAGISFHATGTAEHWNLVGMEDDSLREDILDLALIQQRQGESSRPFRDYMAEREKRGS